MKLTCVIAFSREKGHENTQTNVLENGFKFS